MTDFKNVEKKYYPIPFWSWNSKLDKEETVRQIEIMDNAKIGGYFMHARGGLITEYMSDEWFENISVAIKEGNKRSMQSWAYDENGWPSGFGNGVVNGMGEEYQQKYLMWDKNIHLSDRTIYIDEDIRFYYDVNPFYVDVIDKKVTLKFINEIYRPYYERYKNSFCGFFTDEPQIARNKIPWSFVIEDEYEKEYGEKLKHHLKELFFEVEDYENTRVKFWRLITKLFSDNFFKPIYDWCVEYNLGFTGHLLNEEKIPWQLTCNGACMPHYEYFTMPGMDWLGRDRDITECLTPLQVTSVAHQLGKKEIISENFAMCGHNIGFDELKAIYQWQMVNGITKLCQHLEGYSLKGLRKRDYPPAMYYQQPWWNEYDVFNEAMSRIGKILCEGEVRYDTLLMHNQSSGWKCYDNDENKDIYKYNDALVSDYKTLLSKHILFHFGDEIIMERHAKVEGNELIIGKQRYKTVVIPKNRGFLENTQKLLDEFEKNGGRITTADKMEFNDICSSSDITYTERNFDDFKVYYFVNNNNTQINAIFKKGTKVMDINTGEVSLFDRKYTFAPYESLVVIDDFENVLQNKTTSKKQLKKLDISGEWEIASCTENILTLDTCDVYFDGKLAGKNENAADVLYMALKLKRKVNIRCEYSFDAGFVPKSVFLVCEEPEKFNICINGIEADKTDKGFFVDKDFRKISISKMICVGKNTISLSIDFIPNPKLFEDLEKATVFESEKNKLTFDTEIEPVYIVGDFGVDTTGEFIKLENDAVRYIGGVKISEPKTKIRLNNIEQQGYPFFSGRLTVKKTFNISDLNCGIFFSKKGVNVVNITVNGKKIKSIMWQPFMCDLSKNLVLGENTVELTIVNNLRNMLGPHHLVEGECWRVFPHQFYKRGNIWTNMINNEWDDNYCFAEVGIW